MEDKLEIEVIENDEKKKYEIRTFLMQKMEQFREDKDSMLQKVKATEKKVAELTEVLDQKIT